MITPAGARSGSRHPNQPVVGICTTSTSFHPETWTPMNIESVLKGIYFINVRSFRWRVGGMKSTVEQTINMQSTVITIQNPIHGYKICFQICTIKFGWWYIQTGQIGRPIQTKPSGTVKSGTLMIWNWIQNNVTTELTQRPPSYKRARRERNPPIEQNQSKKVIISDSNQKNLCHLLPETKKRNPAHKTNRVIVSDSESEELSPSPLRNKENRPESKTSR